MRKFCMLAAAALALAGCAPSTGGSKSDKVNLTVLSWRPEDTAGYQKIFSAYEKTHSKVKITFKPIKNTEYLTVLPTELRKTTGGPDVVQLKPYGPIQSLITAGNLVPLDGQVSTAGWSDKVLQAAKGKTDGKLYGVPYALQTLQVLYNKKIFADKGIQPPTTWAQFTAACDKLKKAGITPMATSGLQPWVLAIDRQIFGATRVGGNDFEKAVLSGKKNFTDPDYTASLSVVNQLKPYFPDKVAAVDYPDAQTMFSSGKAAMYPGGSYEIAPLSANGVQIGSFDAPPAPGSLTQTPLTSGFVDGSYGVNAKSAHRKEAVELLKWMATPDFAKRFTDTLKQIPTVPGVQPSDPLLAQMAQGYQQHGATYLQVVDFGYGNPLGRDQEGLALQKLMGGMSPADAGKLVQKGVSAWFKPSGG